MYTLGTREVKERAYHETYPLSCQASHRLCDGRRGRIPDKGHKGRERAFELHGDATKDIARWKGWLADESVSLQQTPVIFECSTQISHERRAACRSPHCYARFVDRTLASTIVDAACPPKHPV